MAARTKSRGGPGVGRNSTRAKSARRKTPGTCEDEFAEAAPTESQERPRRADSTGERVVIPIAGEELKVNKRTRQTARIKIRVVPHARIQSVDVPVTTEDVRVERIKVNRVVDKAFGQRQEGDTTVVPVFEEVLVVEKRLMLKEEVRITRRRETRHERRDVALQTEQVQITRTNG